VPFPLALLILITLARFTALAFFLSLLYFVVNVLPFAVNGLT